MEIDLPFKLSKKHKGNTKWQWKNRGMLFTEEGFEEWYNKYIYTTHCELCNFKFLKSNQRNLDHNHNNGIVRNIVCSKCNNRKNDKVFNNKSNLRHIYPIKLRSGNDSYKFEIKIREGNNRKTIVAKYNKNLEELINYRNNWYKENNYFS